MKGLLKRRWVAAVGASVATYLPVVAGIIEPMIWPLLIASPLLYHFLYWWWGPLEQYFWPQWYFITCYITDTRWVNHLAPTVITIGGSIFIIGLSQIVQAKARRTGLVTTGLYRFIRHPQHLGIVVTSLGFMMLNGYGIRVGDIYAWSLVVFIYILLADSEEEALEKEFGDSYLNYKRRVPFMVPFLPSSYGRVPKLLPEKGWRRRLALIGAYAAVLVITTWLLILIPKVHIR